MTFSFSILALIVLFTLPVVVLLWATESKQHRARRMRGLRLHLSPDRQSDQNERNNGPKLLQTVRCLSINY